MVLVMSVPATITDYKQPVDITEENGRDSCHQLMRTRNVETESSRWSGNVREANEFLFGGTRRFDNHDLGNYRSCRRNSTAVINIVSAVGVIN